MQKNEFFRNLKSLLSFEEYIDPLVPQIKTIEDLARGDLDDVGSRARLLELTQGMLLTLAQTIPYEKINEPGFKIDIHSHGKLTLMVPEFNERACRAMIDVAKKRGLDGLVFTEHMQYPNFFRDLDLVEQLAQEHPDFVVMTGGEINVVEPRAQADVLVGGGDILVIGSKKELKRLDGHILAMGGRSTLTQGYVPRFNDLIKAIGRTKEDYQGERTSFIAIATHILRATHELCDRDTLDPTVPLNSEHINGFDSPVKDWEELYSTRMVAQRLAKPLFYSSDAHTPLEAGGLYTIIDCNPQDIQSPGDVIEKLMAGETRDPLPVVQNELKESTRRIMQVSYLLKKIIVEAGAYHRVERH